MTDVPPISCTVRDTCRICFSRQLVTFLEFGPMPLAGGFITSAQVTEEKLYPVTVVLCRQCKEVQILETVDASVLFQDYRFLASTTKTLSAHFAQLAAELASRFMSDGALVVEFGSNDGVLLTPLREQGFRVVGVEPATNIANVAVAKGHIVVNDFFGPASAALVRERHGAADVICANNVFAHIDDMHAPMRAINDLLKPDGVFVFEVHYLGSLMESCQYDMIYHEHLMYHSLTSLMALMAVHQMTIFDAKLIPTHAGSVRVFAQRLGTGRHARTPAVPELLDRECRMGLDREETFLAFGRDVFRRRDALTHFVETLCAGGRRVVGYGASGRASVHLNLCGFGPSVIPYVADASPERQGRLMPGTHNPIVSPKRLAEDQPDFAVLFAYNYLDEVLQKERLFLEKGGHFILPLPTPRIVGLDAIT